MISWPWDSVVTGFGDNGFPIYDRSYKAEQLREVLKRFFSNGVFMDEPNQFHVTPGDGMNVIVDPGSCFIQGDVGYEIAQRELAIQAPSSEDRIDTVIIRWDANIEARTVDLYVLQGAASVTPVRPTLTRTESVWEIGLCDIFIPKSSAAIAADRITDTRLETERCGAVTPLLNVDTTTFFDQIQAAVDRAVKLSNDTLSGSLAAGFQDQIDENAESISKNAEAIDTKVSKSGDTMTGTLTNTKGGVSTWIKMRDVAAIKIPKPDSGVTSGVSLKTASGNWDIGTYTADENLHIVYSSDANYGSNTNTVSQLTIPNDVKRLALSVAYPVGAVYISYVATSPASLFGGTWTQLTGKFLRMANDVSTGGADTITLTTAQMPAHAHGFTSGNTASAASITHVLGMVKHAGTSGFATSSTAWFVGWNKAEATMNNAGSGNAHSNAPAYQDLYAWRRTA